MKHSLTAFFSTFATRLLLIAACVGISSELHAAEVLLVDNDDNAPDVRSFYTQALDELSVSHDVWDISVSGQPNAFLLQNYAAVVWFTGDDFTQVGPDATGEVNLSAYLNGGGCLMLSSQDYLFDRPVPAFASTYLGVASRNDDVGHSLVGGVGPFSAFGVVDLNVPAGFVGNFSDNLQPVADPAVGSAFIGDVFDGPDPGIAALFKLTDTYRSLFLAFPFEALNTELDRLIAMSAAMTYCGVPTLSPRSKVLLVDDDDNNPDVQTTYSQTLDALGIGYDIWEEGGIEVGAAMQRYAAVIWFTGADFGGTTAPTAGPSGSAEGALGAYLDSGGCLFMSSQDYLFDRGVTGFGNSYLGISSPTVDVGQTTVTGAGPFSGLGPYNLAYPFMNFSDEVAPTASAEVAFSGDMGNAGTSKIGGTFRSTFWGFPFESISSAADREAAMRRVLEYCQLPSLGQTKFRFQRLWPTLQQPWYFGSPFDVGVDAEGFLYVLDVANSRVLKFTAQGQFVTQWGQFGLDPGELGGPQRIALTADRTVYVADTQNHRVQKLSKDGAFLTTWGSSGSGPGQFDLPAGIAADSEDFIYVVDGGNHRIQKFTGDGGFVSQWGSLGSANSQFNFSEPSSTSGAKAGGIAVDREGFVYVADIGNHRIQKFTTDGQFVTAWGSQGNGPGQFDEPIDVAIGPDGSVYVVDQENERVQRFTPDGVFTSEWGEFGVGGSGTFSVPLGLTVDQQGNVYVADFLNRVSKFTANGTFLVQWGSPGDSPGRFNGVDNIAVDGAGDFYVSDRFNSRVQKFAADGQHLLGWGSQGSGDGQFRGAGGVAIDSNGFVFVVDINGARVQKFTSGGTFESKWGSQGSGNGQFDFPTAIAVDGNDDVYVIDEGNKRVQKFDSNGNFLLAFGGSGTGDGQFNLPAGLAIDSSGFVYVADQFLSRVQKFAPDGTFLSKWGASGLGEGQLSFPAGLSIDDAGFVYVAETITGRIQKFTANGNFIQVVGEKGSGPGQFSLARNVSVLPDGRLVTSDDGTNRIQVFLPVQFEDNTKAILVAGGGPFAGNNLWDATRAMANFAYRTLTYQGFNRDTLFYLSPDTATDVDGNGEFDDIDANATKANLQDAIVNWAADADDVIVYLTDHGGDGNFRVNGTETVTSAELEGWLDQLQAAIPGKLTIIYDACNSGSFVPATSGPNRVVITSTAQDESAYFTGQGALSFSTYFWTSVFNGKTIFEAFDSAREALTSSGEAPSPLQSPQLDADGNGSPNQSSDETALGNAVIGSGTTNLGGAPTIASVTPPQIISDTSTATITASGVTDGDGLGRVWAVLRPPDFDPGASDNPITELPRFDLLETAPGSGIFQSTFSGFTRPGLYQVSVYAEDSLSNTSLPKITSVTVGSPLTRQAVIVAGGETGDELWPAIEKSATSAYQALKFQGYKDSEISFLSATTVNGMEQLNTLINLQFALAPAQHSDSQDVVVYLVGSITGGAFRVNAADTLTTSQFDAWLDALQGALEGKLTVVVDAPGSGAFVSVLDAPAGGEDDRIRISSTTGTGPSIFPQGGTASFSRIFWQQVANGARLGDAFVQARNAMSLMSAGTQRARLDADGDGDSDKFDLAQIPNFSLGPGILLAGDAPLIGAVSSQVTLSDGSTVADVFAENVSTTGTIQRVFAVITPPVKPGVPPVPVEIELLPAGGGRYEATFGGFGPTAGVYQVAIFAVDTDGVVSLTDETRVTQLVGPDAFEDDDAPARASVIVTNSDTSQQHTIHDPGDADWVKFFAVGNVSYDIKASNVGANADLVIELFNTDGVTLIDTVDDGLAGIDELLSFAVPAGADGVYFVKVRHSSSTVSGAGTNYDLNVDRPVAPDVGVIRGLVRSDVNQAALSAAVVRAGAAASTLTLPDGSFVLFVNPGLVDVVSKLAGFLDGIVSGVKVASSATTEINLTMELIGTDSDNDGVPDSSDNCVTVANSDQLDTDGDGEGDVCDADPGTGGAEPDTDNDGIPDNTDNCPTVANANQLNTDNDNQGNACDTDDDNDGMPDNFETSNGFDPLDASDATLDSDNDGLTNLREAELGTNPNNADTDGDGVSDGDEVAAGTDPKVNVSAVIQIINSILLSDE